MGKDNRKKLSQRELDGLLKILEVRFAENPKRHRGIAWVQVASKLETSDKLWSLNEMERTGGEPDVVGYDKNTGEFIFYDCAEESPKGRRSLCYDEAALKSRKEHKPKDSATAMAAAMGIKLLTENEYLDLQQLGDFDSKTSSWLQTPPDIRELGGAIYGDFRYGRTFIGHNGAESYYGARGFRGSLRI